MRRQKRHGHRISLRRCIAFGELCGLQRRHRLHLQDGRCSVAELLFAALSRTTVQKRHKGKCPRSKLDWGIFRRVTNKHENMSDSMQHREFPKVNFSQFRLDYFLMQAWHLDQLPEHVLLTVPAIIQEPKTWEQTSLCEIG